MKETKIIQVYPSDSAIEKAIKEWEAFGWEMTDNQRYSDKSSVTLPYLGTETTTTTYNKLTFSREKSSSWYSEVKQLEEEYEAIKGNISSIMYNKPRKKGIGFLDFLTIYLPVPLISFVVYQIIKKARFKKATKRFEENSRSKLQELNSKADAVKNSAEKIVNAV
ncbi:MAG: hypothetical protein K2O41_04570 [Clostridia bacterium]|nr:hypothetical protein [Clostridia bacterium]